jgi:hypothetical protein
MGIKIALTVGLLITIAIGIICVMWPEKVQEYALKWSAQGLGKFNPFLDWMKTRSYVAALRIIGLVAIGAVILVFFIIFKESS